MAAEDNVNKTQLGPWIPNLQRDDSIQWHMVSFHHQVHDGDFPAKYDDEGWQKLHNQLHAEDKLSKPHQHFTPKKRK